MSKVLLRRGIPVAGSGATTAKPIPTSCITICFFTYLLSSAIPADIRAKHARAKEASTSSNEVIVEVTTSEDGLVVIQGIKPGREGRTPDPERVYGFAPVKEDVNTTVMVQLSETLPQGRHLAVLYVDAGEDGQFEPGTDKMAETPEGRPVMDRFKAK